VAGAREALSIGSGGAAMTIGYAQKAARRLESSTKNPLLGRLERWFGNSSWLERLLAAALVALVLASLQFAMDEAEVQVFMREGETDARLLTDDLPLDAYADRGFAVFLRNVTVHGLDSDGAVDDTASDEAPAEARSIKRVFRLMKHRVKSLSLALGLAFISNQDMALAQMQNVECRARRAGSAIGFKAGKRGPRPRHLDELFPASGRR